jgi:fructuronate reductase
MTRLSLATLASLPASVVRPAFDPNAVSVGIVHLGLGAFHRAHQAVFTDDVLASDPRWGILGVSMKTPRATRPLAE